MHTFSTRWQFCIECYMLVNLSIYFFCCRFLCNWSIWQCSLLNWKVKLQSHWFIGWLELQHSGRNWGFLWREQSVREPGEHDHHLLHKGLLVWQTGRGESGGKFQISASETKYPLQHPNGAINVLLPIWVSQRKI